MIRSAIRAYIFLQIDRHMNSFRYGRYFSRGSVGGAGGADADRIGEGGDEDEAGGDEDVDEGGGPVLNVTLDKETFEADAAAGGHLGLRDEYNPRSDSKTPGMVINDVASLAV